MGNSGSHRRHHSNIPPPTPPPATRQTHSQYVFASATPYPSQYPNQFYHPYPGYYPPPVPVHGAYGYHHHIPTGHYPAHPPNPPPPPPPQYMEHQKAVTIRNDVNVKKETLRVEPDEENPGKFLVAFTFDATAPASITVTFFGKDDVDCSIIATKEDLLKPVTITFQQGLGQKFRQPCGTGIDFSMFDEAALSKVNDAEIYPIIVRAEAHPSDASETEANPSGNSQITMAVFEKKEEGSVRAQVMKQILWVNRVRYDLLEIYGIGSTATGDETDSGKECVICMSEPRDTTVLPCRHMCMCSECAKVLQFQTNRCPICRQPVERLLEIKLNNADDD